MRRLVPFAILAGCLGVGVLPALAADTLVNAGASSWNPSEFAVQPGDTVTWANSSGFVHNLHVEEVEVQRDGPAWTYSDSYPARAAAYSFHCSLHPGMSGRFYVNATGTVPAPSPTPSPTASPTATPTGTPSPSGSGGSGGSGGTSPSPASGTTGSSPGSGAAVTSFRARAARGSFCTRRTVRCRRPGVILLIDLAAREAVRVRGTLRRGARRVRSVSLLVRPGSRRVRLPGPRLRPGRYALTLRAGDITRRVRFRVRSA